MFIHGHYADGSGGIAVITLKQYSVMKAVAILLITALFASTSVHGSMEGDWKAANAKAQRDGADAYRKFLKKHPQSPYRQEALDKIEERARKSFTAANTLPSETQAQRDHKKQWLGYLVSEYPDSPLTADANALISDLVWQDVQASPTRAALSKYINTYPNGSHVAEATRIRDNLKLELLAAKEWESGQAPQGCSWRCDNAACSSDDLDPTVWAAAVKFKEQQSTITSPRVQILFAPFVYDGKSYSCNYTRNSEGSSAGNRTVQVSSCSTVAESGNTAVGSRSVSGEPPSYIASFIKPDRKSAWTRNCD
jgi:hypothetical protein